MTLLLQLRSLAIGDGLSPLPGKTDFYLRRIGPFYTAVSLRATTEERGSCFVELIVGLEDELMPEPFRMSTQARWFLNRSEVVHASWARHETWREHDSDALRLSLTEIGLPFLRDLSNIEALHKLFTELFEAGHPLDPQARRRGVLSRVLGRNFELASPRAPGVPAAALALGRYYEFVGMKDKAVDYLARARNQLLAPPMRDQLAAVDARIERIASAK